jgi:hypothetical protein
MSDEQKIEELIQALGNGEWHPSGSHVDGQSQTIDVLSVRKALSHENEKIRFGAVCVLGWMRPEIGVEPPITTILNDKDCRVRSQAAFWLGAYRDERAIPALILGLNDRQGYFLLGLGQQTFFFRLANGLLIRFSRLCRRLMCLWFLT